ncbi:MAG: hypothetical protein IH588_09475 [Anaerolineales bacterium]|nr:hypothetical protein [Anaerolineales bacterium]
MVQKTTEKKNDQSVESDDRKVIVEILLAYSKEEWEQRRQSENQRSMMTNFILTIASAITVLILNNGLTMSSLPLSILLVLLGIFGAIAVAKLYERGEFHIERSKAWRDRINELYPEAELDIRRKQANTSHATKFGRTIRERIRLHSLWVNFNVAIAILGFAFVLIIFFTNI